MLMLTLIRNMLLLGLRWSWGLYVSPKRLHLTTKLHGVTSQKTQNLFCLRGNVWAWVCRQLSILTSSSRVLPENLTCPKLLKKFPDFVEPEGLSPHSQQPATWFRGFFEYVVIWLIFYGEELLAPRSIKSWGTTPCRLSATSYSIYSQLPSLSGGRSSILNLRTRHAVVTGTRLSRKQLRTVKVKFAL